MKTLASLFILPLILVSCNSSASKDSPGGEKDAWIQLFNGKDLEGWVIKINGYPLGENYNNTFRVEDGKMVTRYDEYENFTNQYGHIFYDTPFSHYRLRVEYRVVGEQVSGGQGWARKNSGAMLHCQSPESMLVDQDFPVSIEAQFLGGLGEGERPTGNLCTPGTHVHMNGELVTKHCITSGSPTFHGEEWVIFEAVVLGDSIIHHLVNGDTVLTYTRPVVGGGNKPENYPLEDGTPVGEGYISLQAESHPYEFRKVELLDLSK